MSDWSNQVTDAWKACRDTFGVTLTIAGVDYRGVMRDTSSLMPLMSGGFPVDYSGAVEVLSSEINPAIGTKVTIGTATYRIEHKQGSDEDPVTVLYLQGISK